MQDCYEEEFADVPATMQDYLNELPSRCGLHIIRFQSWCRVRVRVKVNKSGNEGWFWGQAQHCWVETRHTQLQA